jgi:hypothetical protein
MAPGAGGPYASEKVAMAMESHIVTASTLFPPTNYHGSRARTA